MNFSVVDDKDVVTSFTRVVNRAIAEFSEKYQACGFLKRSVNINPNDFTDSLSDLGAVVRLSGHSVSLIVDEVDSFANRLLVQVGREKGLDSSGYHEFVKKEGSVLRQFGRVVKMQSSTCIKRMFFTGVMPVAWSDVFSSLNTVFDLTHIHPFHDALGFKSSDIAELLTQRFPEITSEERDIHLESIKSTSNEYRRSSAQSDGLYNPQGVWYYLTQLEAMGSQMVPRLDPNIVQPLRDEVATFLVTHAASKLIDSHLVANFSIPLMFQKRRRHIRPYTS